jgi:tetratricopeptide (TPR) repeat protein
MNGLALLLAALLAGATPATTPSPAQRFTAAGDAYLAGDLDTAMREWEALAAEGYESPALYLDLGNARLRAGRRGAAIASYLRALRLDPGDPDARQNLELARSANVDRLVGAAGPSLLGRVAARTRDGVAVAAFALPWWLLWAALAWRLVTGRRLRAWLAVGSGLCTLAAMLGGAVLLARDADQREPAGVVITPQSGLREGPEEALRPSTTLHEGTEVKVLEVRGAAVRVRLANGLEGWLPARELEAI